MNNQDVEMIVALNAMNKFFYYSMNIPYVQTTFSMPWDDSIKKTEWLPEFIKNIKWDCHVAHIVNLWHDAEENGGAYGKLMYFYSTLDNEHRIKLLDRINSTYNGEAKLFK